MRTSNEGKVELIGHEGIALSKYKDSVGVWTIAVGATKTEIPDLADWPLDKKITMQDAFELFSKSLGRYEDALNKALTREIHQYQFDALVSWCYNVGVGWVNKASVIRLLNTGEATPEKLKSALMLFNKPKEIISRRMKEATLLASGKYSNDGKALLFPVSSRGYPMYSKGEMINVWKFISQTAPEPSALEVFQHEEKNHESKPNIITRGLDTLGSLFNFNKGKE